jgi:hypothetical protein
MRGACGFSSRGAALFLAAVLAAAVFASVGGPALRLPSAVAAAHCTPLGRPFAYACAVVARLGSPLWNQLVVPVANGLLIPAANVCIYVWNVAVVGYDGS